MGGQVERHSSPSTTLLPNCLLLLHYAGDTAILNKITTVVLAPQWCNEFPILLPTSGQQKLC